MIMVAREGQIRGVIPPERAAIEGLLVADMDMNADEADGLIRQMESIVYDITLPASALTPMNRLLRDNIDRDAAADLAGMLLQVASADGDPSPGQKAFIRAYRESWDLN